MSTKNKGFSLIELMIVIAIIGILAAIAVPSYQTHIKKAKVAKLLTYIEGGQTVIAEYVASTGNTDCSSLTQPATPDDVDYFGYANWRCQVEVDAFLESDLGELFYIWYDPTIQSDGSISWQCYYYLDPNGYDAPYAPLGCINDGA